MQVLLCEWLGTPVAVKRVVDKKPDALNDGQGSEFEQELEVLSQVSLPSPPHPNPATPRRLPTSSTPNPEP